MEKKQLRLCIIFLLEIIFIIVVLIQFSGVMLGSPTRNSTPTQKTWNERGAILDRNASIIAIQAERDTVLGWRPEIQNVDEVSTVLAKILERDPKEIYEHILSKQGNIIIERTISLEASEQIVALKNEGALNGIYLVPDKKRLYPEGKLAAQLVGYVGIDNTGLDGIEYTFDKELSSTPELAFGNHVYLTININIQRALHELARETFEKEQARYVTLIVMDARTGEILAYVAHPSYDPNRFTEYTATERKNRLVADVYEPGSVFKIFSIASFLELQTLNMNDLFDARGPYISPDGSFTIRDIGNYGIVNVEEIIKFSSNVGIAYAADRVSSESFHYMLKQFGFGNKTNIDLNGEEAGILNPPVRWSQRSKQTIAIGQEIGITALQIVTAATAFANDGILLKPLIIRKIVTPVGNILHQAERTVLRAVLSPETSKTMLKLMQSSTKDNGTARRLQIDGMHISAKTGTAEVYDPKLGTYSKEKFIASTIAIVPSENPELIVYAAIHEPSAGEIYGGRIAAPVVRRAIEFLIAERVLRHPDSRTVIQDNSIAVVTPRLPELSDVLPEYKGFSKRSLLPLLREERLRVRIIGNGWVVRQYPPAGTVLTPDMELILELE